MTTVVTKPEQKQKKKPKFNLKNYLIHILRKASYRWPPRHQALKNGKIGRNMYICRVCGSDKVYGRKEVQLDHIEPAVRLTGWVSLEDFAERLYCEESGFQVLCKKHHEEKTKKEKVIRKQYKDLERQGK